MPQRRQVGVLVATLPLMHRLRLRQVVRPIWVSQLNEE
jgi:hypothetical protein